MAVLGMSGIFAECTSALFFVPAENVSQRLQVHGMTGIQRYANINDIIKTMLHYEGWTGLYRGYRASLYTYAPGSATWWATYELSKKPIHLMMDITSSAFSKSNDHMIDHTVHVICGALAGLTSCLVTNPLDVVKTRLQTLDISNIANRSTIQSGMWPMLFSMFRKEGIRGLYRGLTARLMVNIPGSACAFFAYELVKQHSLKPTAKTIDEVACMNLGPS
jgi:hypothetical protein